MKFYKISIIFILFICCSCSKTEEKPDDFDEFWNDALLELGTTVSFEKVRDSIADNKKWTLNKIMSYQDVYFYAWVAEPIVAGEYPIKVKFSEFGKGQSNKDIVPNKWFLRQKNTINMVVNVRGQGLSSEQIQFKGYLTKGLKDKNNYIFKGAYLDAAKAIDFITMNPKSNSNIIVTGNGQGGTLSIVAAALKQQVTMCVVGFPFLTDIGNYNKKTWPMKMIIHGAYSNNIDLEDLKKTLSYFDMINFAEKIRVPFFIRTQEMDSLTSLESYLGFFNKLKSIEKNIYTDPCYDPGCSSTSKTANELERIFVINNMLKNDIKGISN